MYIAMHGSKSVIIFSCNNRSRIYLPLGFTWLDVLIFCEFCFCFTHCAGCVEDVQGLPTHPLPRAGDTAIKSVQIYIVFEKHKSKTAKNLSAMYDAANTLFLI
jgi:hypothetical protein